MASVLNKLGSKALVPAARSFSATAGGHGG